MQTFTNRFRNGLQRFSLLAAMIFMGTWLNAQTNYYSKASAVNFSDVNSWGTNTDGSGTAPGSISSADNFFIQNGALMVLDASSSVRALTIGNTTSGRLTIAANTLTVGTSATMAASFLTVDALGTLTVTGGTTNINGRFNVLTVTAAFNQSGGAINVDGNAAGVAANSVPSGAFIVQFTSALLNLTGGTLTIVDPHANPTATACFYYNPSNSAHTNSGTGHTFAFGDGVSTDVGGSTSGFLHNTWPGSGRFLFGNLVINAGSGTNRHVQSSWGHGVAGNLTITSGDYRINNQCNVAGNITNNGTITTTSTLYFGNFQNGTSSASTSAQTVTGTGVYRNNAVSASSTANFTSLTVNNTNASGVTFNANSLLCVTGGVTNTGTASGTTTFTAGIVNTPNSTTPYIIGVNTTTVGTLSYTAGGFGSGSAMRKWYGTGTMTTGAAPTANAFPFVAGGSSRMVTMNKSAAWTTGGWIQATHTNVAGFTADVFTDGAYSVQQRTNSNWSFTSGGGINTGATTIAVGLRTEGLIVTAAAPGTAPRLIQVGAAVATHSAGTGTTASPVANRSGLTLAQLTTGSHYAGINSADIGLYSVANGDWNTGSTWSTGNVPTATDNPLIASGTTVTVSSAATALTATVSGALTVSGGTLTIVGASTTGITVASGGNLNVSGGTVNVGPQDNSFCNRRVTVSSSGALNVTTGDINIAGNLTIASGGKITQSGGLIKVDGNAAGVAANSVAVGTNIVDFTISSTANAVLTGGTLHIVDPHTGTSITTDRAFGNQTGVDFACGAGHTFKFGNGASTNTTTNAAGFVQETYIGSTRMRYGNLVIDAGASSPTNIISQQYTTQFVGVEGDMTITSGDYRNTGTLTIAGNLVNNGTLTSTGTLAMSSSSGTGTYVTATSTSAISGSGTFRNLTAAPTANLTAFYIRNSVAGGVTMNIPLTMSGLLTMFEGKLNTTSTNILTMYSATGNINTSGTTATSWVNGPMARRVPASTALNAFFATMPVGKTAPNWVTINPSTDAAGTVTFTAEVFDANAGTAGSSIVSLNSGRRWDINAAGPGAVTSYALTTYDANIVNGNAIVGSSTAAGTYEIIGNGSTFTAAAAPLPARLAMSTNELTLLPFPLSFGFGQTGPLNVGLILTAQVTGGMQQGSVAAATTASAVQRFTIACTGSSGTINMTGVKWTYTGTADADIASVSLWAGNLTNPTGTAIATTTLSGGVASFGSLTTPIVAGQNTFWIQVNTAGSASIGDLVDGYIALGDITFAVAGGATATGSFPTANLDPAGNRFIDYCAPTYATGGTTDNVTNVTLVGSTVTLNNSSTGNVSPYYTFYNAVNIPDLQQGSGYTVNVTQGTDANQWSRVWIDFNRNGQLEASESFTTGTNAGGSGTAAISITVPGGAVLGNTRMRVRGGSDNAVLAANACGAANALDAYGEAEDYIVEITTPTPISVSSITATNTITSLVPAATNENLLRVNIATAGSAGALELNSLKFTYSGTTAADIAAAGVKLWAGTASGPVTQLGTAQSLSAGTCTFSGLTSAIVSGANYYWITVNIAASATIDNVVDGQIAIGDIVISNTAPGVAAGSQPTALLNPAGNRLIDYCLTSQSSGSSGDGVIGVVLNGNTINLNNVTASAGAPYYTYYNAVNIPDMYQGGTYTVSVTHGTDGNQYSGVWIDFNKDGVFATTEYFSTGTNAGASGTSNITISVPAITFVGNVRMRVRGGNDNPMVNTNACGATPWGETEDYIVELQAPPGCAANLGLLPVTATATASNVAVCIGGSTTLNITTPTTLPTLTGLSYEWVSDVAVGGTYATVVATTATPLYTFAPTTTKYYRCRVLCNGSFAGLISSSILVTVSNPQVTSSTGATRCGQGTVTLSAVAPGTITWYDSPTGAPLASGASYSPTVTATKTFYAATSVGGVTESAGTTPAATTGFLTTDWGVQFNALQEITLNSTTIYPVGTGTVTIALLNAGGIEIATSASTPVTGNGSTAVVVPLGFNVQVGAGYRLQIKAYNGITDMVREFSMTGLPFNSPSGAISIVGGWNGAGTTSYYYFYNLNVSTGCIGDKVPVVATVSAPTPLVMLPGNTASICKGLPVNLSVISADLGYAYTWDNGLGSGSSKTATPLVNTSYVVTAVNSSTGCNTTGSISVTVNPLPSAPTVTSSVPSYCPVLLDAPSLVTASATLTNFVMNETFESGAPTWTKLNNSTGGTPALAAWTNRTSPYTYSATVHNSGATNDKFMMSNSDEQGSGGTTATELISPVFAISASAGTATLEFDHYFNYIGGDVAAIEISTNGGSSYAVIHDFDTDLGDVGTPTAFAHQTYSLNAYIGQSNLKIRFRYDGSYSWWWAVDDVVITQTLSTNQFAFSPAGGLFNDLLTTTQYVDGNVQTSVYAAPFSSTTYNVSVVDPITNCPSLPTTTTVTVCSQVTDIICGASAVTVNDAPPVSQAAIPTYNSIGTTTGGQAGTCQAFTNDSWYKVMVPASGDIHVYTFETGNATLLDLTQTMITIFTSSDGTCSGTLTQVSCDNGAGQGAHSYASAAGLTPGLYAYVRVATPTTSPTPAGKYKMWVMSGLYWTATSSTSWTDPANWYGGDATTPSIVPDLNKTVIIPNNTANNYPVISGTSAICAGITFRTNSIVNVPSINIPSGAELKIQSKLGTKKAFIRSAGFYASSLIPSFTGIGTLRFNEGGNNLAEVLNRVTFKGVVAVRNLVTVTSNGNMRFDNNAVLLSGGVAPTDPLKNYAGGVTGDIRVTRTGSVYAGFNYWCSPITNATTASLATSYGNNLYQYDNTLAGGSIQGGWGNVITSAIPMQAGRGYIQTYAGNGTVVFTGPAREGFFNTPVTVTAGNNFNLVGNPFPSALSYDLLRGGNASLGSIYLWHSSGVAPYNTSSYVVMSGPNGGPYVVAGNPVAGFSASEIGVGQGFLAQVSSAGNIAFNSNQRVAAYPGNSTQFLDAADYSTMKVRLTSPSQSAFDAVVAFGGSGTDGVDFGLDAPRMPSSNTFELFTYIGTGEYTIQFGGALQSTKVVDLGTVMTAPGTYSFSLENFDNFDASVRVYIEDVKTGAYHNLKAGSPYAFVNDPSFTATRFKLHFMAPIAYTATGSCINETNGKLLVVNPNSANPVTASLRDAQGAVIATSAPFSGEHEFANLGSGSYNLETSYDGSDVFASAVTVDGGGISSPATFVASANEVSIADAIVEFSANAPGANVFEWNFGDGSPEVTGTSTPVHAYMAPGIYTVTLKASLNGGCATAATSTVTVTDNATGLANVAGNSGFTIYPNPANEVANLLFNADLKDSEVTISITDAAGRIVSKKNVNNLRSGAIVGLDINELANGVYEVTVAGKNFRNVGRLTIAK